MSINKTAIYYDIISEYKAKGANDATKSLGALNALGGKLAKTLGATFSAVAIEQFAAKSVAAFMKEDAALKILSQTLGNLGLSFKTLEVSGFITTLAESTGVIKEQLFPAFETLIRYTGDVTKAQDLLKLSLDVSAGTGKDTAAVALALGKAYGGNTVALGRLGAGLTKAELSSKNFLLVQSRLGTLFKGDAAAAADSYTGKVNRLKVAFDEMKIKIGEGIVNGLLALGKDTSIASLTQQMDEFGTSIGNAIQGMGILLAKLDSKTGNSNWLSKILGGTLSVIKKINPLQYAYNAVVGVALDAKANQLSNDTYSRAKQTLVAQNASLTAKKAALVVDQKALQAAKDKAALDKASAALKLAGSVFDMSQIEIVAALQRNISDDQALRLNLQLAILNQNSTAAAKLTQELLSTQIAALLVQQANPFDTWTKSMEDALNALIDLQKQMAQFAAIVPTSAAAASAIILGQDAAAAIKDATDPTFQANTDATNKLVNDAIDTKLLEDSIQAQIDALINGSAADSNTSAVNANGSSFFSNSSSYNPLSGMTVNVMIDPATLTSVVTTGQQNVTAGGIVVGTTRINAPAIG